MATLPSSDADCFAAGSSEDMDADGTGPSMRPSRKAASTSAAVMTTFLTTQTFSALL